MTSSTAERRPPPFTRASAPTDHCSPWPSPWPPPPLVAIVGLFVDGRMITGLPLWDKPLKFAISVGIYSLTFGWLIGQLRRGRRVAWWAGTVAAVFLGVEMVVIVGQALRYTTSHFNVSTPFDAALWSVMGELDRRGLGGHPGDRASCCSPIPGRTRPATWRSAPAP